MTRAVLSTASLHLMACLSLALGLVHCSDNSSVASAPRHRDATSSPETTSDSDNSNDSTTQTTDSTPNVANKIPVNSSNVGANKSNAQPSTQSSGGGSLGNTASVSAEPEPVEYPLMDFSGSGVSSHGGDNGKQLPATSSLTMSMDASAVKLEITAAHIDCSPVSGCTGVHQLRVDSDVNNSLVGVNTYDRASAAEIAAAGDNYKAASAYAIFAKAAHGKDGRNFTFSPPIPVAPWPGSKARYALLAAGGSNWPTTVNCDNAIPNDPFTDYAIAQNQAPTGAAGILGTSVTQFPLSMALSYQDSGTNTVSVTFDLTLSSDSGFRTLYKHFPMSKTAVYGIDTTAMQFTDINSTGWFFGDTGEQPSKLPESSHVDYKLCTITTSKGTQTLCQ